MGYRELQLRQLIKDNYIPKSQYQQEISELKKTQAQELVNTLQKDLGINFLLDYSEIVAKLKGRTIEEVLKGEEGLLKTNKALTILANKRKEELEQEKSALINLAKQKIANKKEFQTLLTGLESKWNQDKEIWNQEKTQLTKNHQKELAKKAIEIKDLEEELTQSEDKNQEQLKNIALLFIEDVDNITDFNNLYQLLKVIAERKNEYDEFLSNKNRERESKNGDKWWWNK